MIYGWAFAIIDAALNPPGHDGRRRTLDDLVAYDDRCKVRDSDLINVSSCVSPDEPFVVWVVPKSVGEGYTVRYQARSGVFGGIQHGRTLDEAMSKYDRLRGARVEQLSMFGAA